MNNQKISELKKISDEEHKKILLQITDEIHNFCINNNIMYWLGYGTLLGAVRHKGIIPWDDDIDLIMPRKDFDKFINNFNENRNDKLKVVTYKNTSGYYLPIAKVIDERTILRENVVDPIDLGVYVDVLVIDKLSDDYKNACKIVRKIKKYNNILILKNITPIPERSQIKNIILVISQLIFKFINRINIISKMDNIAQTYNHLESSKYCGAVAALVYGKKELIETSWFDDTILMDFENKKYNVPSGYDKILSSLYGDYMTPPPIEKQITHHSFKAYWK